MSSPQNNHDDHALDRSGWWEQNRHTSSLAESKATLLRLAEVCSRAASYHRGTGAESDRTSIVDAFCEALEVGGYTREELTSMWAALLLGEQATRKVARRRVNGHKRTSNNHHGLHND
jgi:hypothetical protein